MIYNGKPRQQQAALGFASPARDLDCLAFPRTGAETVIGATGAWRAIAHIGRGELEQACEVGRIALERLPYVHSPRCLTHLRHLADELRGRKVNSHVREFSAELDRRLKLVA